LADLVEFLSAGEYGLRPLTGLLDLLFEPPLQTGAGEQRPRCGSVNLSGELSLEMSLFVLGMALHLTPFRPPL
jgi:hypothetical protein